MKKNVIIVFWIFILLFVLLIANIVKFSLFDSKELVSTTYNPRISRFNPKIKRGTIYDRNGNKLVESIKKGNIFERVYIYPEQFAHITGYTENGTSGIESKYNFTLQTMNDELLQRIYNLLGADEPRGNDLYLTIDRDLQLEAYDKLKNNRGAIILSEINSGKILVMVSNPSFNPQNISKEWEKLNSDANSPLLNRASQGLYPPGSTFKIITALAAIENLPNYNTFSYKCTGTAEFKNKIISCYNKAVHRNINLKEALKQSCNTFFAKLGSMINTTSFRNTAEKALFNADIDFQLPYSKSSFSLDTSSSVSEIVETSIGQGKTLATPLHINLITSAIANKGVMMKPYIAEYAKDYANKTNYIQTPEVLATVCSSEIAQEISEMLDYAVSQKTSNGQNIAGKTGTAENPFGKDHSWFTAFAPSENPKYAITIILENNGKGSTAIPIAKELLSLALS